ncbi:F-actin-monooxygenase mical1 isoform X2 [Brachyhypopomus gauderio]|uniref:F-actin-monooxygenase mical1 isoform X2 n=1 Tax=Brachyhypopomus gauderio TaxID=698409 RepID=UPI0040433810
MLLGYHSHQKAGSLYTVQRLVGPAQHPVSMADQQKNVNQAHALFENFVAAQTCKDVRQTFADLCRHLEVDPKDYRHFYGRLKEKLNFWKAKELWQKIDKRASHPDYEQGKPCATTECLVLGAGPCGLRTAIELALLGARVVLLDKRRSFSRNNVLHLWPYTIRDLRNLGAKKFYGRFCSGSLDHISIRQLQLILLKLVLLLGVEVHMGVTFKGLVEPQESGATGWTASLHPPSHPVASYRFDVFISAGGGRFVPDGFKIKELRGKLAIGITANFINHHSAAEAQVQEISGVARIYNQKFFQNLHTERGIDLENIVYYKDDTHYFVMTAKKHSLLKKGVIKQDYGEAAQLLAPANVSQEALLQYAHDAAHFSTGGQLPKLDFALDHKGQPDVAAFDFTSMHRAENASMVRERYGHKILIGLVGDCLVEPFWPLGTGIARGFLAAFDTAWMVRSWAKGVPHLQLLAERESVYQLLSQTTPENTSKNYSTYSINPRSRYRNVNMFSIKPKQVKHLYDVDSHSDGSVLAKKKKGPFPSKKQDSLTRMADLMSWCQQHTAWCGRVEVKDFSQSWRSGLALCALIHHFRPSLIDMSSLDKNTAVDNNQLAFYILQREFGIEPIMSASDLASSKEIDQLSVVLYLTQVHNAFTQTPPPTERSNSKSASLARARSAVFFLNKLKHNSLQRRKERLAAEKEEREQNMRAEDDSQRPAPSAPATEAGTSEMCYFCHKHLYVVERGSAEGKFFHRGCFTCQQCGVTLRQGGYAFHSDTGKFFCEQHSEAMEENGEEKSEPVQADRAMGTQDGGSTHSEEEKSNESKNENDEEKEVNEPLQTRRSVRRKGSYKISIDPDCVEMTEPNSHADQEKQLAANGDQEPRNPGKPSALCGDWQLPVSEADRLQDGAEPFFPTAAPVPAPRGSRSTTPVPKPRTIHNVVPSTVFDPTLAVGHGAEPGSPPSQAELGSSPGQADSRPKQSLRKLQLTSEEKTQLVNLSFSQDSDPETPASSSAASTSSSSKPHDGGEEEGYWSGGGGHIRDKKNRRCFRRKGEPQQSAQSLQGRVRSKFSPWNLSSPRLQQRFSVLKVHRVVSPQPDSEEEEDETDAVDDEDDEENGANEENLVSVDHYVDGQAVQLKLSEAERQELMKMRTLERRAKMSEMQRFRKAQSIQRRLEEIEVTFKDLEEKGVVLERSLRGEPGSDGSVMIDQWIDLVQQKNALVSEESDLMVASRQLELEDQQCVLELELRHCMETDDSEKTAEQQAEEEQILQKMLDVVDMRNSLVAFLEEKRLKEMSEEEQLGSSVVESRRCSASGAQVHWA